MKRKNAARGVRKGGASYGIESISKKIIDQLIGFMLGALSASINELGTISPFGVALVTAADTEHSVCVGLGAAAGYILTQDNLSALRYIAAIICSVILIRLMQEIEKASKFRLLPSCISFLSLFLTSMAVLFASDVSIRAFLLFLSEALIGFALSYFFSSAKDAVYSSARQGGYTVRDIAVISILINVFLLSVSEITFYSISFSRILGVLFILLISYIYKEAGGAVCGISASLILSVNENAGALGISYAVSGLAAGLFSYFNRYAGALAFVVSLSVVFAFEGGTIDKLYFLTEVVLACTVFLSIPEKYIKRLGDYLIIIREPQTVSSQRQAVLERLRNASTAVSEVSATVNAASDILKKREPESELGVYSRVKDGVCADCRLNSFCWNKNFKDCKAAFDEMSAILKDNKTVNTKNMPKFLTSCCVKTTELADSFNKNYISFVTNRTAKEKVEKIRSVTSMQFGSVCDMLAHMSQELAQEISFNDELAQGIEEMLINEFGITTEALVCMYDESGKLKIEFSFKKRKDKLNEYELRRSLEAVSRTKLDRPSVVSRGNTVSVSFCEKTKFRVEASATRIVAGKEKYCGDSFESFYDGKGRYIVVLSDGMGTGMRAAVDSSLASSMMSRLLRSDFSFDAAFRVVNSALMLKSAEESLATLDILNIDLYTGNAMLYKAGAASTLVKKRGIVTQISKASMPAGILEETELACACLRLRRDDIIVMASDGAFEYSENTARSILSSYTQDGVEALAESICEAAGRERSKKTKDDITVIAVKLVLNE